MGKDLPSTSYSISARFAAAREHVEPFIQECVDRSALIHTDGSLLYAFLDREGYQHERTIVQDLVHASRSSPTPTARSLPRRVRLPLHTAIAIQPQPRPEQLELTGYP
jgi:ISXO2-like transposase domain